MLARPDGRRRSSGAHDLDPGGDGLDFDDAFRRHHGAVFGLAHRLVGDAALADEVTQDVFLQLWQQPDRFDPSRGSLRSFLLTKCHGRSIDLVRRESARRRREERDGRARSADPVVDVAAQVCDMALHEQAVAMVRALPDAERQAILLAYSAGMTYRKTATELDVAEGTIKTRIRSGLRKLRAEMQELGIEAT